MERIERLIGRLSARLPDGFRRAASRWTRSHRRFVSRPGGFDLSAASQFALLALLGLREESTLLDLGCGSLRAGRLFLVYLEPGRYVGVEPQRWLIEAAIRNEIGADLVRLKRPMFVHRDDFRLDGIGRRFDFVIAGSVFSHAAAAQIGVCLGEVAKVLREDGVFVASFVEAASDHGGESWVYPERVGYRFETLRAMALAAGLRCERLDWPYEFERGGQVWLAFVHDITPAGAGERR